MQQIFTLFYITLFGALLSAEIGDRTFRILHFTSQHIAIFTIYVLLLVVARSLYFGWMHRQLPSGGSTPSLAHMVLLLLLAMPVVGFQQLAYIFVHVCTGTLIEKGIEAWSWTVLAAASAVPPVLFTCTRGAALVGGQPQERISTQHESNQSTNEQRPDHSDAAMQRHSHTRPLGHSLYVLMALLPLLYIAWWTYKWGHLVRAGTREIEVSLLYAYTVTTILTGLILLFAALAAYRQLSALREQAQAAKEQIVAITGQMVVAQEQLRDIKRSRDFEVARAIFDFYGKDLTPVRAFVFNELENIYQDLKAIPADERYPWELNNRIRQVSQGTITIDDVRLLVTSLDQVSFLLRPEFMSHRLIEEFTPVVTRFCRYLEMFIADEEAWRKRRGDVPNLFGPRFCELCRSFSGYNWGRGHPEQPFQQEQDGS